MINYAYSNEFKEKTGGKILHYLKNYNTPIPTVHNIILNDIMNLINTTKHHHFTQRLKLQETAYTHNPRYEDRRERTIINTIYQDSHIIIVIADKIIMFNEHNGLDRTFNLSTYTNIIELLDQMV